MVPVKKLHRTRGGILVDTIVVMTVIVLLTAIAVPVYMGDAAAAQLDQAKSEIRALADGQLAAAEAHGFYLPLQMLDDIATNPAVGAPGRTDNIAGEPASIMLITPAGGQAAKGDASAANLREQWAGPFVEIKRVHLAAPPEGSAPNNYAERSVSLDYPLDPWGQPYRFYSPTGIVGANAVQTNPDAFDSIEFSDGTLTEIEDRFNRFAIVSFGPDSRSDFESGNSDDIILMFGPDAAEELADES